jgi:hypothetical protein
MRMSSQSPAKIPRMQLVPAAEFGADGVPQELHDLDTILVFDAVRAADILPQIRLDRRIGKIVHAV